MHRVEDYEYGKSFAGGKDEKTKFWMDASTTGINFTQKHGFRAGANAVSNVVTNDIFQSAHTRKRAVLRRFNANWWQNLPDTASEDLINQFKEQCKKQVLKLMVIINFGLGHERYYNKILQFYASCVDMEEVRKLVPNSVIHGEAISLQLCFFYANNVVRFDENIIEPVFANNCRQSFQVKHDTLITK